MVCPAGIIYLKCQLPASSSAITAPDALYSDGSVPDVIFELCIETLPFDGAVTVIGTLPVAPVLTVTVADGLLRVNVIAPDPGLGKVAVTVYDATVS